MHKAQSLINHVALVLDASWSMRGKESALTRVTDEQIKHLAAESAKYNQETRVSVYRFGETTIECLIFDMDVARLPSTADLYEVLYENTSLIDATLKSQEDLDTTSQLYGDHAFLTFVLTDGKENRSRRGWFDLDARLRRADVNWSLGFLVPDENGVSILERAGVLRDSIAVWDTAGTAGLDFVSSSIKTATSNFFGQRKSGVRGTRSVFSTGADAVNPETVKSNLTAIPYANYTILTAVRGMEKVEIRDFVEDTLGRYVKGNAYYRLEKSEKIQASKKVIVVDKSNGTAYAGAAGRQLIGLPDHEVRVRPEDNPKYDVFIQSNSVNRHINAGNKVLVLK